MPEHQQIQQSQKPDTTFQKQATPVSQTPVSNPYSIIQRAKINPKSLTYADIMQLQRTIGNRAVGRLLTGIGNTSTVQQATIQRQEIPEEEEPLQGKMIETVQRHEIPEEEEPLQGKMAETIQRQEIPEEEEPLQGKMIGTIQRQEIPEEEEPLQGKFENEPEIACPSCFAAPIVQRQKIPEEEEPLQGKIIDTVQRQEIPEEEEPLQTKRENNTGMPDNLKAGVESLSEIDMSDVRVHYNSDKPAEVGALAYTQGTDIHVAPGQEEHLPHEAWHVVQQKQEMVQPTIKIAGIAINDNRYLENEADLMGGKAAKKIVGMGGIEEAKSQLVSNSVTQHKRSVNQNFSISGSPIQMIGINRHIIQRQGTSDFEGILKDKPGKKKEHKVLVYGTEDSRQKLRTEKKRLPTGFSKRDKQPVGWATTGYYTVDRYNNYSWRDFQYNGESYLSIFNPYYLRDILKPYVVSKYVSPKVSENTENKGEIKNKIEGDLKKWTNTVTPKNEKNEVLNYQDKLLAHPSYSPITTLFEGEDFVKSKESSGDIVKSKESSGDIAKSQFQLQTRRASKFGLQYMKERKGQIAFISWVDKKLGLPVNSDFVLNKNKSKSRPGGTTSGSRVPITVSEQRKLFRIRHGYRGINFYDGNGKLIKAPWNRERDNIKWREYDEKRLLKYKHILTDKLQTTPRSENIEDLKEQLREVLDTKPEYQELSLSEAIYKLTNPTN